MDCTSFTVRFVTRSHLIREEGMPKEDVASYSEKVGYVMRIEVQYLPAGIYYDKRLIFHEFSHTRRLFIL